MKGTVTAVCTSRQRGTEKNEVDRIEVQVGWGIAGDAHGGDWHRQISLLSQEQVDRFNRLGAGVGHGDFGENILISGLDLKTLPLGTRIRINQVTLEVTQIGKECHSHCQIYQRVGDCIMPREGIFARVITGGEIKKGDVAEIV